jgi:hypothetical protein
MKTITLTDDELEMVLTSLTALQKKILDDDTLLSEFQQRVPHVISTDEMRNYFVESSRARLTIQHLANKLRTYTWKPAEGAGEA